jgi:RNA polymerase sigma factor (sigma-70 family)
MIDDAELLRRYAADGSEPAFTELVSRNIDLVYAAALRHGADEHQAKDIAQTVFVDLARKARSLRNHPALASWLFTSTRYAALKAFRGERRRQIREHEAHLMQQVPSSDPTPDWAQLRPVLDEVIDALGASDREVIVLRYFRGLPFVEIAAQLKASEGTLRMRADRALDKMSALLAKRGIGSTATALGLALSSQPVVAAPLGLAATVSGIAVTTTTSAGGLGTLLIMSKTKVALVGLVLSGGIVTTVVEHNRSRSMPSQPDRARSAQKRKRRAEKTKYKPDPGSGRVAPPAGGAYPADCARGFRVRWAAGQSKVVGGSDQARASVVSRK